jgi:uncharacterized protein (TIGR02300 family)
VPVAVAEKGLKRICPSCGTRYYDLNKRPVVCPSCATEFTGELKVKARRGRAAAVAEEDVNGPATASRKGANDDAEEDIVEGDADTVSLEDVESDEDAGDDDLDDAMVLDEDLDDDDLEDIDDELEDEADEEADEKE